MLLYLTLHSHRFKCCCISHHTRTGSSAVVSHIHFHRFKCWCCCIGGQESSQGAFEDLARIFSSQFADVDLVASDIAVGLMLVAQQQNIATNRRSSYNEV